MSGTGPERRQRYPERERGGAASLYVRARGAMAGYYHYYRSVWRRRPRFGLYPEDVEAAFLWSVAFSSTALWLIQPYDWLRKKFNSEHENESTK